MTNPETRSQYEGAILNQLVKNVEKIAVIEVTVKQNSEKLDDLDQRVQQNSGKLDDLDQHVQQNSEKLDNLDQRLTSIESLLGWLKVIGSGVVAIALSLIANFIYSLLH